ncbi:pentatricopeptide repeat-containing protein At4g35850, mitochondrial-like [Lycium barbarum]|uniref:pentatricopeptide repeat-containing protein At4g35850, mitochondrial-like n=1 Tax=Lycium barbarum TaxID=112863 RepID=UPI00293F0743|nr:pentatricopeptide repeat-containing protein At4g35850, mitochondrial-like [Lycium barbarum]
MKLLRTLSGPRNLLARTIGRRYFAATPEEYAKRNYANNEAEYSTVIASLTAQRRHYLLRDVYDDMMLDGVKPERDTFHSLLIGTMKGARLQDAFFFRDEMKAMGLVPDVALYNFLISTCGKCKNSEQAVRFLEEMKRFEVKPTGQTYICLLNACAAAGRVDRVYAIVRDMTAAGLGLNKFCYAGLIAAHKNKEPVTDDVASKIIELVEQSKGWSAVEAPSDIPVRSMMGMSEEELYNIPTAEYVFRRGGFLNREFTVYHVAFHACADLKSVESIDALLEMLSKDGKTPDVFILMQTMRCYLHSGDLQRGRKIFEDYMSSGKPPMIELYVTLVEGAMVGYSPEGMQLAEETLVNMNSRNFFLSPKMGSDLLLVAAGEKTGGYTTANLIWDMMQARKITPTFPAVQAYHDGLKVREIPADDPRLQLVSRTYNNLRQRFGGGAGMGAGRP